MSIVRVLLTIAGTAAYLGLAILGWGGTAAFFAHSALAALAVVLFALAGAALFADGKLSPGRREDRANRWVVCHQGNWPSRAHRRGLDRHPAGPRHQVELERHGFRCPVIKGLSACADHAVAQAPLQ
jgi:hypothetical protein